MNSQTSISSTKSIETQLHVVNEVVILFAFLRVGVGVVHGLLVGK